MCTSLNVAKVPNAFTVMASKKFFNGQGAHAPQQDSMLYRVQCTQCGRVAKRIFAQDNTSWAGFKNILGEQLSLVVTNKGDKSWCVKCAEAAGHAISNISSYDEWIAPEDMSCTPCVYWDLQGETLTYDQFHAETNYVWTNVLGNNLKCARRPTNEAPDAMPMKVELVNSDNNGDLNAKIQAMAAQVAEMSQQMKTVNVVVEKKMNQDGVKMGDVVDQMAQLSQQMKTLSSVVEKIICKMDQNSVNMEAKMEAMAVQVAGMREQMATPSSASSTFMAVYGGGMDGELEHGKDGCAGKGTDADL